MTLLFNPISSDISFTVTFTLLPKVSYWLLIFFSLHMSSVLCYMSYSESYHKNYRFVFISKVACKDPILSVHISSLKIYHIIIGLFIKR